jgi:hypothetical protein
MRCNLTYALTAGGRVNGQRCGSCDAGPLFVCALQAWDGLCASKYCSHLALCDDIPPCYSGTYLDQRVIGSESAYMGQRLFGSGGTFLDRKQYSCEPCPAGRFGNASGLVGEGCSGKCAAGHFCPKGSVSEYASRCGGNAYYCPLGSALPLTAPAGRRTVGGDPDGMTRDGTVLCDPGHYCVGGEQKACKAYYKEGLSLPCPAFRWSSPKPSKTPQSQPSMSPQPPSGPHLPRPPSRHFSRPHPPRAPPLRTSFSLIIIFSARQSARQATFVHLGPLPPLPVPRENSGCIRDCGIRIARATVPWDISVPKVL